MSGILLLVSSASGAGALTSNRDEATNAICDAAVIYTVEEGTAYYSNSHFDHWQEGMAAVMENMTNPGAISMPDTEALYEIERPDVRAQLFRKLESTWDDVIAAASPRDAKVFRRFGDRSHQVHQAIIERATSGTQDVESTISGLKATRTGDELMLFLVSVFGWTPSDARSYVAAKIAASQLMARRCPSMG